MKTIKVTVTKEMIQQTHYMDNRDCAICRTLRNLGYDIKSAGGDYIETTKNDRFFFLNNTHLDLCRAFSNKGRGEPYGDVMCELQEPPKAKQQPQPEPKERIVYVMVDSTVKELSGQLTNN